MSSPLHDVVIRFAYAPNFTVPDLISTMEKILVEYYNRQGPDHPRKIDSLAISFQPHNYSLTFYARSRSTPTSNLELQFVFTDEDVLRKDNAAEMTFAHFPSGDIREFSIDRLPLTHGMLWKLGGLSHLRLRNQLDQDFRRVLDALSLCNEGVSSKTTEGISNHVRIQTSPVSTPSSNSNR